MEDGMPSQIEKISKEQLYQSYKKVFNLYNKYKGRYVDLRGHYKQLLQENVKTKNVLQVSLLKKPETCFVYFCQQ